MHDLYQKFTSHLKEALLRAHVLAKREKKEMVSPQHLFLSLASQHGSLAAEILHKKGVREDLPLSLSSLPDLEPGELQLDLAAKEIIQRMVSLAFEYKHYYIGTEHLLAALIEEPSAFLKSYLSDKDINQRELNKELEHVLSSTSHFADFTQLFSSFSSSSVGDNKKNANFENPSVLHRSASTLDSFGIDLTDPDVQVKIDPLIGRENEVNRLVQVLSRRNKNNPLLIGDPGVGKTAIVEGLAKRIVSGNVPDILKNKRIVTLDLSSVVAGTMYRGEFESRLKAIIEELEQAQDTIIFIDEIHTIIGAGSSTGGSLDAANILKPALARGTVRCIGATTMAEYRKSIESDPALDRRFQAIIIREPSLKESLKVLQGIKGNYEKFHNVKISSEALRAAVDLSVRFLPEKHLPDKAIDLIDEAAAKARLQMADQEDYKKIKDLEKKLEQINLDKEELVLREQFDEAWKLKVKQRELAARLRTAKNNLFKNSANVTITPRMVAEVVSQITDIPLDHIFQDRELRLANLDKTLKKRIIGQDDAIDSITHSIRRAQVGLSKPDRPLGSFMFLGPSGVGKTALAKALAYEVFGIEDALIRLDMSEYSEKFNISKMLGAPAGYVGYKESGLLTEKVKRRPYSVILFDEIEKAHPEVFNVLLQILDEGFVTDAVGDKINFRNTIIILTSNLGAEDFNLQAHLGFAEKDKDMNSAEQKILFSELKEKMRTKLEKHFRPEFLNRLDKVVIFNPLSGQDLLKIVEIELKDLQKRLREQDIKISIPLNVKRWLAQKSFSPHQGAREISRQVQNYLEKPLISQMISQSVTSGDILQAKLIKEKIEIEKKVK